MCGLFPDSSPEQGYRIKTNKELQLNILFQSGQKTLRKVQLFVKFSMERRLRWTNSYKTFTMDTVNGHIFIHLCPWKPWSTQQLLPTLTCHHQSEKLPTPYHSDALCGSHPPPHSSNYSFSVLSPLLECQLLGDKIFVKAAFKSAAWGTNYINIVYMCTYTYRVRCSQVTWFWLVRTWHVVLTSRVE